MIKFTHFMLLMLLLSFSCCSPPPPPDWLVPPVYDDINLFNEGLVAVERNGKWGYIDSTGKEVIALQYKQAGDFKGGLAQVMIARKHGVINKQGKAIIPAKYDDIACHTKDFILVSQDNKHWKMFDRQGKVLTTLKFDRFDINSGFLYITQGDNTGIASKKGKMLYPKKCWVIHSFKEGIARIWNHQELSAFIDTLGNQITPFVYEREDLVKTWRYPRIWMNADFSEGMAMVMRNRKAGFIDKKGKVVIPLKYDEAWSFKDGMACVGLRKERSSHEKSYGYINKKGIVVIPLVFQNIGKAKEGLIRVKQKEKWGFVDTKGKVIVPMIYDKAGNFNEGWAKVSKQKKWTFINKKGKVLLPANRAYDEAGDFYEGFARVKQGNQWGFINSTGKEVIAPQYDKTEDFHKGLARVTRNNKQGLIDTQGRVVCPLRYNKVVHFSEKTGLTKVNILHKKHPRFKTYTGYVNRAGKDIINSQGYVVAGKRFAEGLLAVEKQDKVGYIDSSGRLIIPFMFERGSDFEHGIARVQLLKRVEENKKGFTKVSYQKKYGIIKNPLRKRSKK